MRLILLGTPGAGKGEQATRLSERFHIPHISTGELLRREMEEKTPVGRRIAEFVNRGELVSDEITQAILEDRVREADCESGFILDGFPRNQNQADFLNQALERMNVPVDAVLNIEVPDSTVIDRLTNRHRTDDTPETIRHRLKIYRKVTAPLVDYYDRAGILRRIDGDGSLEEVTQRILKCLVRTT
ncbi:MAG: adenylate kinase [Gemmatimonadetes bacterium]|nr:adenylate kinase [Gemmatimonadota bacterium]